MSTAPREPKNGQTSANTISPMITQRCVLGRVRKLLMAGEINLRSERRLVTALHCLSNKTRKNISTEHTAMTVRVKGPWL
ncbi:hypothetical protein D3C72_1967770 [compost metagenome]